MSIVCAIPIQIPVHRVRVTVKCLATGGPLHTAALRLADYWGESPEEIAEVLGLSIPRTQTLLADLERGGEPIEREFVLWVDHARENVLHYSALSGVAARPNKNGPITLPVDPPTPNRLQEMGLNAGISWDLGLDGYAEVTDVIDVVADIRASRNLPHVLRLPDTQLLIAERERKADTTTTPPDDATTTISAFEFWIAQHGTIDPQLTSWARSNYKEELEELAAQIELAPTTIARDETLQLTSDDDWDAHEPHPAKVREELNELAEGARERLVIGAPDLSHIPAWIEEAITEASERDVEIVRTEQSAARTLTVMADDDHALIHSDPDAVLDRRADPKRQHLRTTHNDTAIDKLLDRLGLKRLRQIRPRAPLTAGIVKTMLKEALGRLQTELPRTVEPKIEPDDETFAMQTIERGRNPESPTTAAKKAAAGIAWERATSTLVDHLAQQHDELQVIAERWKPEHAKIDLDLIVTDDQKGVTWIIDAKNAKPTDDQLSKLKTQIRLLKDAPRDQRRQSHHRRYRPPQGPARHPGPTHRAPQHPPHHDPAPARPAARQAPAGRAGCASLKSISAAPPLRNLAHQGAGQQSSYFLRKVVQRNGHRHRVPRSPCAICTAGPCERC